MASPKVARVAEEPSVGRFAGWTGNDCHGVMLRMSSTDAGSVPHGTSRTNSQTAKYC